MKRIFYNFSICLFLLLSANIHAQNAVQSSIWESNSERLNSADYFAMKYQNLGLSSSEDMVLKSTKTTKTGWIHHKYNQQYRGLEVMTGVYILHEKEGHIQKANGRILSNINLDIHPAISISSARGIAENSVLTSLLINNKLNEINYIDFVPKFNKQKLCVADKAYPNHSGEYALVWKFDMDHQCFPPKKDQYIVDAHSGEVISKLSLIHHQNIEIDVDTRYYGRRNIIVDSISPTEFILSDTTRGGGIFTVDGYDNKLFKSGDKNNWIIHDEEFESATDLHFCSEKFYDFLLEKFDRKSIDDNDFALTSVVHLGAGTNLVNAFWDGEKASFGEGNCSNYGPLTTLSIVGHEFTHGLTQMTSGLIYAGESGGLNEGISDILGKMLEYEITPNEFTWDLDSVFLRRPGVNLFRSMSNPHKTNHPKYYKGINWFDEVHNTSNVLNFWFYLISDGEKSTNEIGEDYEVIAIGKDKAMQIVYSMEVNYLTPSSNYQDAYKSSIAATIELYGDQGAEIIAIKEAWRAVGVGIIQNDIDDDLGVVIVNPVPGGPGYCPNGELSVTVDINNYGNNKVDKGTKIKIDLRQDNKLITSEFVEFDEDLESGQSISYQFKKLISLDGLSGNSTSLFVAIFKNDDNQGNNNDKGNVNLLANNVAGKDLGVFFVTGLNSVGCISEENENVVLNFGAFVQNLGCEVIEAGTTVDMELTLNNQTKMYSTDLAMDIQVGRFVNVPITTDFDFTEGPFTVEVALKNNWDARSSNDSNSGNGAIRKAVDENYTEDFTNFKPTDSKDISIVGFNLAKAKVNYNNNEMIGITTKRDIDTNRLDDCEMVERFYGPNISTGYLEWCLSVTPGIMHPAFEFDMIQFRKDDVPFRGNSDFQTILQFTIPTDSSFVNQYIYGQNEGELVHHKIPLKADFSGTIRLQVFTGFGNERDLVMGKVEDLDAILLDNIQITDDIPTFVKEPLRQEVLVYPNPSNGLVNFQVKGKDGFESLSILIYDIMGREVHKNVELTSNIYQWNTSNLQSGIYLYDVIEDGKSIGKGRVIVGR